MFFGIIISFFEIAPSPILSFNHNNNSISDDATDIVGDGKLPFYDL